MRPLEWMRAVRDYTPKPPANSSRHSVLWALALRMGATGEGFASARQLADDIVVNERTIRRHITWGMDTGFLNRTRRGHRQGDGRPIASEYRLSQPDMGDRLSGAEGSAEASRCDSREDISTGQTEFSTGQTGLLNRTPVSAPEVCTPEVLLSLPLTRDHPSADRELPLSRAQREREPFDIAQLARELDADFDATGYLAGHNWYGSTEELIEVALAEVKTKYATNDAGAWLLAALKHMSPVRKAARLLELAGDEPDE